MKRALLVVLSAVVASLFPAAAQPRDLEHYAILLEGEPLAAQMSQKALRTRAAVDAAARIEASQETLRGELERRGIHVVGSVHTLLNAVFVAARPEQMAEIKGLPRVRRLAALRRYRPLLDKALPLTGAQQAWQSLLNAGIANPGAGMKIAVIDSGIDENHPAFQDPSLPMPAGFPMCFPDTRPCPFTNNKVIVARSYVHMVASGFGSTDADRAGTSRPDDLSPRDHVGHGTAAAMIAAGNENTGPAATIRGVAPKAYLGNYKIFGSPGVNDGTRGSAVIQALDDAFRDGMDVATLSLGMAPGYAPLDTGDACGEAPGNACDVEAQAVEQAVRGGMAVVVSAGNDGDLGFRLPSLNTIHTPGTAPAAITVGATSNAQFWFSTAALTGGDAPQILQRIPAYFGDGPKLTAPLTAPLRPAAKVGNDGQACTELPNGSLAGTVALVERGTCDFVTKVLVAQRAGALAVLIYREEGGELPFAPLGMSSTGIPAAIIGNSDGRDLASFLETHPDRPITLNPALQSFNDDPDFVSEFSSRGPSIDYAIKPELVTVGTSLYTATQNYDPNGDLYSANRYTAVQGTSFSTPLVAGAVALVKQRNPTFTAAQLKSAVVNTANANVQGSNSVPRVLETGAGKLDIDAAVRTRVTVEPATLSFGSLAAGSAPMSGTLRVQNPDGISLEASIVPDNGTPTHLRIVSASRDAVTVELQQVPSNPGAYTGVIAIRGSNVNLRVPYLYLVSDRTPFDIVPYVSYGFSGVAGEELPYILAFRLFDQYGVALNGVPTRWSVASGGGTVDFADASTDIYGFGGAFVTLGSQFGTNTFTAEAGGLSVTFDGPGVLRPAIAANGVVNGADFQVGNGLAPGSYISIFGANLSESTVGLSAFRLPLSMAGVSVSFDVPSQNISVPARFAYVSPGLINVQVPWEMEGLTSALMKVSIGDVSSALYTVPLARYSPAVFEYADASGVRLAVAQDSAYQVIGTGNPAVRGQTIVLYANGLGPVTNRPASGEVSSGEAISSTLELPQVLIGDRPATVVFSGLTPGSIGLYQINVTVPPELEAKTHTLVIRTGGVSSKVSYLPVR